MYYTFQFPHVDGYDMSRLAWKGKRFSYPQLKGIFTGWFGALVSSDSIRYHINLEQIHHWKLTMAMGTHPRLGEASVFRMLAGESEILGLIAHKF